MLLWLKTVGVFHFNHKVISVLTGFNSQFAAKLELGRDPIGGSFV